MIAKANMTAADAVRSDELNSRVGKLLRFEIAYIDHPAFAEMDLNEPWQEDLEPVNWREAVPRRRSGMPAHLERLCSAPLLTPDREKDLFRLMNYCKWKASSLRSSLDAENFSLEEIAEIEKLLARASQLRNTIVTANIRLVVSIVKKLTSDLNPFDDLLSEGIDCLIKAVDKFDTSRGFRFSTYATLAVRREVFRLVTRSHRDRSRFSTGTSEILTTQLDEQNDDQLDLSTYGQLSKSMMQLIGRLDAREQLIVKSRFGFVDLGEKPSFAKLGARLGISKERVRQLEKRAMDQIRDLIVELKMTHLEFIS